MQDQTLGVRVERHKGEAIRKALVDLGLFDRSRRIRSTGSHISLPIIGIDEESAHQLRNIAEIEVVEEPFQIIDRRISIEDMLGFRPSFEVVGDIAIVEPEGSEAIASALMALHKSIKTVISPISEVEGEFRTRRFKHIAGIPQTITIHKEHGLYYRVDLESAYFSPRLGTERLRVANQVRSSDFVLDMFAGVGPFSLLVAKRGARVVAIDKNPLAVRYLKENAVLNKVEIEVQEGDAAELARLYEDQANHVIMNLPHMASKFLVPAIKATKGSGIVHYYAFAPEDGLYKDIELIKAAAQSIGSSIELLYEGVVRSYAPKRYNVTIEFKVGKIIS
ncbi:MAG: class I SAM-dependent methyltransferase family protein [Methanotrichaceae archaeon]|nr:class I SAM-dependent methyltransferase family protein [Methanotrichaceae archaeon]